MKHVFIALTVAFLTVQPSQALAAIYATGFFSGTIERFDPVTNQQTTFADVSAVDGFVGLSGIAYSSQRRQFAVSGRITNRIYLISGRTGSVVGSHTLADSATPAGLAFDNAGNLYVANAGLGTVSVFDSGWNEINTISKPGQLFGPVGLAFNQDGNLLISSAAFGIFQYNLATDTIDLAINSPGGRSTIAVQSNGNIVQGGAPTTNEVLRWDASGSPLPSIDLTTHLPPPALAFASADFTSPSGVVIDSDGNIIVAALGRTNPFSADDNFQSNGGIFSFNPDGSYSQTIAINTTPFSSVTYVTAVPEPASAMFLTTLAATGWLVQRRRSKK